MGNDYVSIPDTNGKAVEQLSIQIETATDWLENEKEDEEEENGLTRLATLASWLVNLFLLFAKLGAFIVSNSKAVLASFADSAVDLASQLVLSLAEMKVKEYDERYPIGRTRLEALAVIACAAIMSMASLEVIQFSAVDLYNGIVDERPALDLGVMMYVVLGAGTLAKAVLWVLCTAASKMKSSDTMLALAEDHINDVWSNLAAIICSLIAGKFPSVWYLDPVAGIAISVVIIIRWLNVTWDQVKKLTGHTAPPEFVDRVNTLAVEHSDLLEVDITRAYHFGSRYNVEMEIILPAQMTVRESHDIALSLQHKIENLQLVERAMVHVDHQRRDLPEHKVERLLLQASPSSPKNGSGGLPPKKSLSGQINT